MKPTFCMRPGCTRPGLFVRASGRVCGDHFADTQLSPGEAEAFAATLVKPHTPFREAVVIDAARLLRGIARPGVQATVRALAMGALRQAGRAAKG